MSRLNIKDLERIKNGKLVRFNENTKEKYSSLISLSKIQSEISEFRNNRFEILKEFKKDVNERLDFDKGSKIDDSYKIELSPYKLFLKDYLSISIPTILGNSQCLFNKDGLVGVEGESTRELIMKCRMITPYVKQLFNVKDNCNILHNSFYDDYFVNDNDNNKVLNINGDGVLLPFNDYEEIEDKELQDLLSYYYSNQTEILKNILIPNTNSLDKYKQNANREKVLKLYKGVK